MTRLYTSRPKRSVPNQFSTLGSRSRCDGSITIGSTVPSQGAAIDATMTAMSSAPPIATVGCRRTNAPKPPRAGVAKDASAVAVAVVIARSIPDPRIEHDVEQVDHQIHHHVRAGEHQDDALDHRIVA